MKNWDNENPVSDNDDKPMPTPGERYVTVPTPFQHLVSQTHLHRGIVNYGATTSENSIPWTGKEPDLSKSSSTVMFPLLEEAKQLLAESPLSEEAIIRLQCIKNEILMNPSFDFCEFTKGGELWGLKVDESERETDEQPSELTPLIPRDRVKSRTTKVFIYTNSFYLLVYFSVGLLNIILAAMYLDECPKPPTVPLEWLMMGLHLLHCFFDYKSVFKIKSPKVLKRLKCLHRLGFILLLLKFIMSCLEKFYKYPATLPEALSHYPDFKEFPKFLEAFYTFPKQKTLCRFPVFQNVTVCLEIFNKYPSTMPEAFPALKDFIGCWENFYKDTIAMPETDALRPYPSLNNYCDSDLYKTSYYGCIFGIILFALTTLCKYCSKSK